MPCRHCGWRRCSALPRGTPSAPGWTASTISCRRRAWNRPVRRRITASAWSCCRAWESACRPGATPHPARPAPISTWTRTPWCSLRRNRCGNTVPVTSTSMRARPGRHRQRHHAVRRRGHAGTRALSHRACARPARRTASTSTPGCASVAQGLRRLPRPAGPVRRVLDSFHWSGGVTTFDALAVAPVVTLPGNAHARPAGLRHAEGTAHRDTIAYDIDDYVRIACAGTRSGLAQGPVEPDSGRASRLFDDRRPVDALESFFLRCAGVGHPGGDAHAYWTAGKTRTQDTCTPSARRTPNQSRRAYATISARLPLTR